MNNKAQSAETTNEQSTEAQVTTSSHSNGNTYVARSQNHNCNCEECIRSEIENDFFVSCIIYSLIASVFLNIALIFL